MADLSFAFNYAGIASNSNAASAALSRANTTSDAASKALSKAGTASGAAADGSNALSKVTSKSAKWDKAPGASSQVALAIKSTPTSNSRAVHEIVITSAGTIKYIYSSNAAA